MKKNNKKGFTMVELLAVLLLIGILSVIGIASIRGFRNHQREVFNSRQNEMFVEIAKSYIYDHPSMLPKEPFSSDYVTLKELMENKYITSDFVDYDKKRFDESSKVTVTRIGINDYGYRGNLITDDGNNYATAKAKLEFTYTYTNKKRNLTTINKKHYSNNTPIIELEVNSNNDIKIGAYRYVVYKNNLMYKTSDAFYMEHTKEYSDSIILDLNEYTDASYVIKFVFYDENGYQIQDKTEEIIIDQIPPKCVFSNISGKEIVVGNTITMDLTCTDDRSLISDSTKDLSLSDFTVPTYGVLNKISNPTVISKGYKYTITIGGKNYGDFKVSLKENSIKDNAGNAISKTESEELTSYNKAVAGQCNNLTYTESAQTLVSGGTGINYLNNAGVDAQSYTITMDTIAGYKFDDNTSSKTKKCSINKANSSVTCQNKTYNGATQTIATSNGCTLSNHNQINVNNYKVSCVGDSNHNDSSNTCSISKASSSVTCQNKTYNGATQTIATSSGCTLSNQNQKNAGSYTVSCKGDSNHNDSSNTCSISKASSSVTCQNKTYNGETQTIATSNGCTLSGHNKKDAGSYTVSCSGDSNHNDSSNTCTINKKNPTLTLSKSSVTVLSCGTTASFTEKADVKGSFSNSSSDTSKAKVSPESYSSISKNTAKTVTVTGAGKGSATITVKFTPSSSNYNFVSKTLSVTINKGTYSESSKCGTYDCSTHKAMTAEACTQAKGKKVADSVCGMGVSNHGSDICCNFPKTCNYSCCHS